MAQKISPGLLSFCLGILARKIPLWTFSLLSYNFGKEIPFPQPRYFLSRNFGKENTSPQPVPFCQGILARKIALRCL